MADVCVESTSWLLWVVLLRTWVCEHLTETVLFDSCEVELMDRMVVLLFTFWGASILLSTAVAPFYSLTNRTQGSQVLHILQRLLVSLLSSFLPFLFDSSRLNWCEIIYHCGFLFLLWLVVWALLRKLAICIASLEKCLFESFAHFFFFFGRVTWLSCWLFSYPGFLIQFNLLGKKFVSNMAPLFFTWSMVAIQYYINYRCTMLWLTVLKRILHL